MTSNIPSFIELAIKKNVLRFGEFKTKAGRLSPYFFNLGEFNDGESLKELGKYYAQLIIDSGIQFDMIFGAAYKGIPLVSAIAIALADLNINIPYCFNRKESKDHGEGGLIVGSAIDGKVLIIDDVISAGTSINQSIEIIKNHGGHPVAVFVAIDRQEKGKGEISAIQEVNDKFSIPTLSIITLENIVEYLQYDDQFNKELLAIQNYRKEFGIS